MLVGGLRIDNISICMEVNAVGYPDNYALLIVNIGAIHRLRVLLDWRRLRPIDLNLTTFLA